MFLISSKSNALKFHHFGSRATTYDPGRATNIQSIIYMGNRKVFFFSVDNQFLTLENCSIIPTDVHRKEVIYASLLISMQFHRIILASGLLNTSWASIAMATSAPESCNSVPTDGNKQWRLYLLTFPAKSWEDSCLKPGLLFFIIILDIFWIICQAEKPSLFLGSFLLDPWGTIAAMFRLESKSHPVAKSTHLTQVWQSSISFQGMWNCDWELASQSPWVARTIQGTKEYSCYLSQETCSTQKEKTEQKTRKQRQEKTIKSWWLSISQCQSIPDFQLIPHWVLWDNPA